MIRAVTVQDASSIASIYNDYVENTSITFEVNPVTSEDMALRINDCQSNNLPWLVAEHDGKVVGYCYASRWKGRCAYRYAVEATVYVDASSKSKGWGSRLYEQLLHQLENMGFHAVICGIALPNDASVALHEKFGMKKVAHFKEVGRKFDRWVDVGYWQCLLNDEAGRV